MQDFIEEEVVNSYNVPFYAPSIKEIDNEVKKEGSFMMEHIQAFDISVSIGNIDKNIFKIRSIWSCTGLGLRFVQ